MFLRCLKPLCTGRAKFTLPTPASFPPVPASSGFTPVFVLHPYTRIRSCFRFSPNPVPLLPALLLFPSFILIPAFALISDFPPILSRFLPALLLFSSFILIPAFALVSDFFSILPRFFRFYSCFRPSLYPHSLLLTSSLHIHFFYVLNVCVSRQRPIFGSAAMLAKLLAGCLRFGMANIAGIS